MLLFSSNPVKTRWRSWLWTDSRNSRNSRTGRTGLGGWI